MAPVRLLLHPRVNLGDYATNCRERSRYVISIRCSNFRLPTNVTFRQDLTIQVPPEVPPHSARRIRLSVNVSGRPDTKNQRPPFWAYTKAMSFGLGVQCDGVGSWHPNSD